MGKLAHDQLAASVVIVVQVCSGMPGMNGSNRGEVTVVIEIEDVAWLDELSRDPGA